MQVHGHAEAPPTMHTDAPDSEDEAVLPQLPLGPGHSPAVTDRERDGGWVRCQTGWAHGLLACCSKHIGTDYS